MLESPSPESTVRVSSRLSKKRHRNKLELDRDYKGGQLTQAEDRVIKKTKTKTKKDGVVQADGPSPAAINMRKYRQRLKDKGLFEEYRKKENETIKKCRARSSEEKKKLRSEQSKLRTRRWREKQKLKSEKEATHKKGAGREKRKEQHPAAALFENDATEVTVDNGHAAQNQLSQLSSADSTLAVLSALDGFVNTRRKTMNVTNQTMTSYQVMCSVTRPPNPISFCQVKDFQDKAQQHLHSVFQDLKLTQETASGSQQSQQGHGEEGVNADGTTDNGQAAEDNLMLCAVVSRASASFSVNFQSGVWLPFYWCNWCPFETESRASLLQHIVSEHCFACRFCPYMALSRIDVIHHSLTKHPQFSQFHEQRLKACHLKRDQFQLHFKPQSDSQLSRKRAAPNDAHMDRDQRLSSPKYSRGEGDEFGSQADNEETVQDEESSSESVNELPSQFAVTELAERSHQGLPSVSQQETVTGVMENIVSSSSMEPDVGADQTLGTKSQQPASSLCQSPALIRSSFYDPQNPGDQLTVTIKQEPDCNDGEFAHALGRNPAEDVRQSEPAFDANNIDGDGASVQVKQEPEDEHAAPMVDHMNVLYQQASEHSSAFSRSAGSPPLSHIRAEILQRQVEESFGLHPVASTSSVGSDFQESKPYPVHLIAQPKRFAAQEVLDNFLIDSYQSKAAFSESESQAHGIESEDQSSPSVLRRLLTRPLHKGPHQASTDRAELAVENSHTEQEGCLSDDFEQQAGHRQEVDVDTASATQHEDNFLLMSNEQQTLQNKDSLSRRVSADVDDFKSTSMINHVPSHSDALQSETPSSFIKQEPEDSADNYSLALNLIKSSATESNWTSLQGTSSAAASVSRPQKSSQDSCPSQRILARNSTSLHDISPAEKLKSFSNMSLIDLLTMDTDVRPSAVISQSTEGGDSTSDGELRPTTAGEVVWECGFCHFVDCNKSVVQAHRQRHHTQHMVQAGMVKDGIVGGGMGEEVQKWAASSVDDEETPWNRESQGEGECSLSWMDQPSTSREFTDISEHCHIPSSSSYPKARTQSRSQRARGFRRDDNFEYLSDSLVESDSDTELEDMEDKNYEPPKSLDNERIVLSSEEEDFIEDTKSRKVSIKGKKRRGRPPGGKKSSKKIAPVQDAHGERKESKELYRCSSCRRQSGELQAMKDHIRHSLSINHLLMVRPVAQPGALQFICPGDRCTDVRSTLFADCHPYLVHVLQCQGHIFDASKSAVQAAALSAMNRVKKLAGFLNCPINDCYSVSYHEDQLRTHLNDHVEHLYASQMLLFRSVCTVMAKMYGGVADFKRYICYRCSSILMDLPRVVDHMVSDHGGQVRGVLIVAQKSEKQSQGIVVAIQCLKCSLKVPSLTVWFQHECQSTSSESFGEDAAGSEPNSGSASSSKAVTIYNPVPKVPPFHEWIWRLQSSSIKMPTSIALASRSQAETSAQSQLPLIRSILLAKPHKRHSNSHDEGEDHSQLGSVLKDRIDSEEDEEVVTLMIQCENCQQIVPEKNCKQHVCFLRAQEMMKRKKKQDTELQEASTSNASLSQQQLSSSADGSVSHSRLLAALATRHYGSPSAPMSAGPFHPSISTPKSGPTSTTHPSLISLLTSHQNVGLNQSANPHRKQPADPHLTCSGNRQLKQSADLGLTLQDKSLSSQHSEPANKECQNKMTHTVLSHVLKRKLPKEGPQVSQDVPVVQGNADHVKASNTQSCTSNTQPQTAPQVSTAVSLQDVEVQAQEQHQQWTGSAAALISSVSRQSVKRETESDQSSSSLTHPPLMNFLRQQGDRVMQVLGNVLGDQEESSQS